MPLIGFSRSKLVQVLLDVLAICVASLGGFLLRFSYGKIPGPLYWVILWHHLPFFVAIRLLFLWRFKVYRVYWRYMGFRDLQNIILAVAGSTAVSAIYVILAHRLRIFPYPFYMGTFEARYPLGSLAIDALLAVNLISYSRMLMRFAGEARRRPEQDQVRRVLIVGAGRSGEGIARSLGQLGDKDYQLVGFVDANPAKQGALIHGAPVFGGDDLIEQIVKRESVDDVIVAIPEARGAQVRRIVSSCEALPVRLRIFPGFDSLVGDKISPNQLRDIDVEDLLRRPPVKINLEEVAGYISGERVLITGAGGSIGSELCRQIARLGPAQMILLGHGENSIFEIDHELQQDFKMKAEPLICDIKDRARLEQIFAQYQPTVVFHAAAHKHVPLMETNPGEAVKNNVAGTRNLAELATRFNVKKFVLISTDKAVNPTSVMGASKRICELIVQAENQKSETAFMAVRFGNVLGSRGSVVPLMKKQIARGGPVTVTHKDIVRYFMTIPEAVQLVIQAGALGKGGEIFMLDMGEPVKIMELARDLVRLSGLVPDKDIQIQVTGLRPGEKLFEELLTTQEGTMATRHEKIFVLGADRPIVDGLYKTLAELDAAAGQGDNERVRELLKVLVPNYTANGQGSTGKPAETRQVSAPGPTMHLPG